jgi:Curli production assembly/transport component CsgG
MGERHVCVWLLISALGLALLLVEPARAQNFDSALGSVANEIASAVEHAGKKRVAVIDFDQIEGHVTALGRFLAEEISADLAEHPRPFAVIDRANLQSILKEHALSMSGLVNPENAKKLGQIAGVDALVLGTYTDFGESYRLSLKAIATDTAEMVASARTNIPKTNALVGLANELVGERELTAKPAEAEPGRQASATPPTKTAGAGVRPPPSSSGLPSIENAEIGASMNVGWGPLHSVGLHDCMVDRSSIRCSFVIEALANQADYNVKWILAPDAKLIDDFFIEHKRARSYFLDGRGQPQEKLNLRKGDRVWFIAEFDGGSRDITSIRIVQGLEVLETRIK